MNNFGSKFTNNAFVDGAVTAVLSITAVHVDASTAGLESIHVSSADLYQTPRRCHWYS